ncbi:MAG: leucine/isoleucine/valine transporter permease subunit, partial [Chloroflexota bacterium]|nr:leucine/isoleucine/valine transporter permease subunit [Chloroflexota bacterium]
PSLSDWLTSSIQSGLIGGAVGILISLIGMVVRFSERSIIEGVIGLGHALLLAVIFIVAYQAAKSELAVGLRLISGVIAGTVAALLLMGLVLIGERVNLRWMFINASPQLYEFLKFGNLALVPLLGAATGFVAALFRSLDPRLRNALFTGLTIMVLIGVLSDQLLLILNNNGVAAYFRGWLLAPKGITVIGAVLTTVVITVISYALGLRRTRLLDQPRATASAPWLRYTGWVVLLAVLLYLPQVLGAYHSEVLNQVGLFVLMGLGLNIVVGFAGMLDAGYVAFFALGAYVIGMLTSSEGFVAQMTGQWTFWQALPVALVVATLAGILLGIPVLRIRGDYLTIITLGFGEIIRILAGSNWLVPYAGGAQGIAGIPAIEIPGLFSISGPDKPQKLFYLILGCCLLAAFVATRLKHSRLGRAWMAVREDEDVAEAMGINLVQTKLLAFAAGAAFSGLSGAIFAAKLGSIYPHSFALLISINILALIIVGGMGNIYGVILGALVLVGLPELLREFSEFRLLVYGAVLIFMMLQRPEGLLPDKPQQLVPEGA